CIFFFQAEDGIRVATVTEFRRVLFRSQATGTVYVRRDLGILGTLTLFLLLVLELADRVTMKRDLVIAREIQQWLVPEAAPAVPGVDIAFATRPANTVAGDYYDAFLRPATVGGAGHASDPASPRASRLLLVV